MAKATKKTNGEAPPIDPKPTDLKSLHPKGPPRRKKKKLDKRVYERELAKLQRLRRPNSLERIQGKQNLRSGRSDPVP